MSTRKPIYVFEGGGSNPHVIATIDTDKFSDHDSKAETAVISRKVNNISTIEITIPTNCEASRAITNTSDLVLFDTKGNVQEFHITDIDDSDEYSVTRTIYAEQSFGELINNIVTNATPMPTTTNPADYLAYILYFTRWSVGTVESGIYNSKWDMDITGLTCLEAFQKLVDKYNCEFEIRYETDGKNKIIGRYVDLKKRIGSNLGKRFEDSKDIIGLKRTLDLDSVKTAIYPRIKLNSQDEKGNSKTTYVDISSVAWSVDKGDPVNKPIGQTVLVNPDADAMYKRYNNKTGSLMEKIMYAEWTGDTAKDAEDLCKQAWSILKANGVITPTMEVTASDLYRMSGNNPDYIHEQVDLGDTCIIIDKNFEPELRLTTRVMEIEEDILNPVNNTYVFGKYRKTLATSNIESQKSIEEQLGQLQDKIQGITIPEYSLPYQSGKDYYNDVKAQIQNEFMSASGYVMAQDSDGFWVFDAPVPDDREAIYPTKATILKGGCVALAKYNPVTSAWEVGTFINGTTVNADYITAGHLNANVIAAGSITTKHLNTTAIEYIKTGMATDEDLQGVIDSVAKDYATKDSVSSNINNAVKDLVSNSDMNTAISGATKDLATKDSVSSSISTAVKDLVSDSDMNSAITNATKDMATNSSVNSAVTNATKDMATNSSVTTKINNATKDMATNSSVNSAIGNATKDMATNSSVNSAISNATKDMATNSGVNSAIGNATKGLASENYVDNKVSNLSIGGRNLVFDSAFVDGGQGWTLGTNCTIDNTVTLNGHPSCKSNQSGLTENKWRGCITGNLPKQHASFANGETLTYSCWYYVEDATSIDNGFALELKGAKDGTTNVTGIDTYSVVKASVVTKKWTRISKTITLTAKWNDVVIRSHVVKNGTVWFTDFKLEKGNKVTDWSPAPEDAEEQARKARINTIKDLQKQLQTEYNENIAKANKVYVDKYLPAGSTAKVNLNNKMTAYTTAYNNYNKYITTMIADGTVTTPEYTQYNTYATAYATAVKELAEAIEDANSARLANVYAQARQGLVTTADLEVNNQSVIASAKAGMVSTGDMTSSITAATKDLVSNDALNNAIADFTTTSDVSSAISTATKDMATNSSVNSAVTNATKDMATNSSVNSAISTATKDMATTAIMNTAITNATKDMATNSSVNTTVTNATKDLVNNTTLNNAVKDKVTTTQMNNAVNNATKDMATNSSVNNAIGNLQIGGRNLIKNSAFINGISGWLHTKNGLQLILDNSIKLNGHPTVKISNTGLAQNSWYGVKTYSNLVDSTIYKGVTYTLSCWYYIEDKTTVDSNLTLQLKGYKVNATTESSIPNAAFTVLPKDIATEKWTKISVTFTPTESFINCCARAHFDKNGTAWVTDFKLEKGNKATDWSPAPEDTSTAIDNIQIGGRNLFLKSNIDQFGMGNWKNNGDGAVGKVEGTFIDGTKTIKITGANGIQYSSHIRLKRKTTYVYSMMMKSSGSITVNSSNPLHMWLNISQDGGQHLEKVISTSGKLEANKWTKVWVVFETPDTQDVYYMKPFVFGIGTNTVYICKVKIEEGNKATDWTPAPEDTTSEITTATKDMATNTSVNSAINNATKDMATNSSVNTTVKNATKDMATNKGVTDAVNGVVVGSRNLALLTSDDWVSMTNFKGGTNDCRLQYKVLTSGLSVGDKLLIALEYKLENMTYAASGTPIIKFQGSGDVTAWNSGAFYGIYIPNIDKKPINAVGTAYVVNILDSDHIKNTCWNCNFRTDYLTGGTVSIRRIRVVRSSKLIDWTAAPEDAYTTTVKETFKAITAEYNNNYKVATTMYANTYLDGTAKTNLKAAYDDYKNKYNSVKAAHDAILNTNFANDFRKTAWNTSLTNLQTSTSTLGVRVQEASTYINTAIYNASKTYTDKAIPDALTGYAKTSYVDSAKADAIKDAKKGMVSTSQLEVNNTEILMKSASMGQYNILRNTDFRDNMNYWKTWGTDAKETIKVVGETATTPGAAMSGERNLVIMGADNATTGGKNIGFCQETTKCVVGVSYTVGYWVNCTGCSCVVQVESIDSKSTTSLLVKKSYQNINGGHDRATWKYDSLTFTVPNGSAKINFVVQLTNASAATHRVLLVKPMMTTGINAQAWTAHPDEIHVGVVSVTEQNGIKVEHSDFNTYTTLNAAGLKVYDKSDNNMIASFGESGSAYIGDLSCDGYVKAPQLMPMSKQVGTGVAVYCSETGSGNQSGNSSNYAMGWAGAMRVVLNYLGIDNTHTEGGFIVNSNTRSVKGAVISIYIKGSTFTNNIELNNVYGRVTFHIYFDAGCKFTGQMRFSNVEAEINIDGSKTAVLQRGSSDDFAIQCYNVRLLYLHDIYINYTKSGISNHPVYAYHTHCYFSVVDFCNCRSMASIADVYLEVFNCQGSLYSYVSNGDRSFVNLTSATVPVVSSIAPYTDANNATTFTGTTKPTASVQKGASSVTINVTKTFNSDTYSSYRLYGGRNGVLLQGAPNADELNKYGNYYGRIYFNSSAFAEAMNSINNAVVQLYLERYASISEETDYVDVYIGGTKVGSLESEHGDWYTVPTGAINSLKNGSGYIELNATGVNNYTRYKLNVVLKITGTQTF